VIKKNVENILKYEKKTYDRNTVQVKCTNKTDTTGATGTITKSVRI
jgi:hypothetical protein